MAKEWQHIDLSKATIFDLTDDESLIRRAEDCIEGEDTPDSATYQEMYSRTHIIDSLIAFAEITNDEPLYRAILKANPEYEEVPCCIIGAKIFE